MKIGTHKFKEMRKGEVQKLRNYGFIPNHDAKYYKCEECGIIIYDFNGKCSISEFHRQNIYNPEYISCRDFIIQEIIK